jgi:hypothetical protein
VELGHSEEIWGFGLFLHFCHRCHASVGSDQIDALINGCTRDTIQTSTAGEKKLAVELGGGFLFSLRVAGCLIVEAKQTGLRGETLEIPANTTFDQQAMPNSEYLRTRCSGSEKITLVVT